MTNETREKVAGYVKAASAAESCCPELRQVCAEWLDAAGTEREAEMTKLLLAELADDVMPIDRVIAFFGSPSGEATFGKQAAANMLAEEKAAKARGEEFCTCEACQAGAKILAMKEELI